MKRITYLLISMLMFLFGCAPKKESMVDMVEPDPTPKSMTYDGTTTNWLYEIPCTLDLPVGGVKIAAVYFGETKTDEGYSTIMHVELSLPDEMPSDQIKWFLEDDFSGFVYIGGKDEDIDVSYGFGKFGAYDTMTETNVYGKTVYVVSKLQRNARYSVLDKSLKFIFNYETKDDKISYVIETKITENVMSNFNAAGDVTSVGDAAADYIARRAQTIQG